MIIYKILRVTRVIKTNKTFLWTLFMYQFFSFESTIVDLLIETIACKKILGTYYMLSDPSVKCYDKSYYQYSMAINLPILILVAVIIPFFTYYKLRKTAFSNYQEESEVKR